MTTPVILQTIAAMVVAFTPIVGAIFMLANRITLMTERIAAMRGDLEAETKGGVERSRRIDALEQQFIRMDSKLDTIQRTLTDLAKRS